MRLASPFSRWLATFCALLALSFPARAQGPAEVVLAHVRQVRSVLLEQHVPAPSAARVEQGAWRAVGGSGAWSDFEQAVRLLPPDRLARAGQAAVEGMVEAVGDPYTAVLDPDDMRRETETRETGRFAGVGVELAWDGGLIVVAPLPGSPAAEAGLRPGDRIRAVEGRPTAGLTFYAAGALLTGEPGTRVALDLERGGQAFRRVVTRRALRLPGVEARRLAGGAGYLRIGYFGPSTAREVRRALQGLAACPGLVLDLRGNPGGDFEQGLQVAGLFRSGDLVIVESRRGSQRVRSTGTPAWARPVAILVDRGSASASEIVGQALQGTPGCTLVGQRTFGKALVQTLYRLPGGYGLKVTTARYLGRDGVSVQGKGLQPDVPVRAGMDPLPAALRALKGAVGVIPAQRISCGSAKG